jgi:hypothetical protein
LACGPRARRLAGHSCLGEEGSGRPLRAVVRLTADSGRGFERELMFSEPAPVEALVRAWLDDVLAGDR